jgi:hypothetical protein
MRRPSRAASRRLAGCPLVAALVSAFALSGCGARSSSVAPLTEPTDATMAAFCRTFGRLAPGTTMRQAATDFARVGTPAGITPDQRRGYVVLVAQMRTMPEPGTAADFDAQLNRLSHRDHRAVNAFFDYVRSRCNSPAS